MRLYRNYDLTLDQGPLQMVSSFRGLTEMINVRRGSGLIIDWKQCGGTLLVGGDSRIIRVWDAHTESQVLVRFLRSTYYVLYSPINLGPGNQCGEPRHVHNL